MKRAFQSASAHSKQTQRDSNTPRVLRHLAHIDRQRDWLTIPQLAEHGKFMSRDGRTFSSEAARMFVTRHPDLPRARRGRQILIDRDVFDRYVADAGRRSA